MEKELRMWSDRFIGSGDVRALIAGFNTKLYASLQNKIFNNEKKVYNSLASTIPQFRTGKIIEDRYLLKCENDEFPQVVAYCNKYDIFKATIDIAKMKNGVIVSATEIKSMFFDKFGVVKSEINRIGFNSNEYLKKKHKEYYYQMQQQMLCSGLTCEKLKILRIDCYDDVINKNRIIKDNEEIEMIIHRDNEAIDFIIERDQPFQYLKDYYRLKK